MLVTKFSDARSLGFVIFSYEQMDRKTSKTNQHIRQNANYDKK